MYTRQRKDGKTVYVEKYKDELTGKWKSVSVTYDRDTPHNRKEASYFLQNAISERQVSTSTDYTLNALIREYRAFQRVSVKVSTYERNYHTMETLKRILGEDTLVGKMTVRYVREKLLDTGKKPGTLNEYIARFKAMLRWAYQSQLIDSITLADRLQPFQDVPHRVKIEDKYLESEQAAALIEGMSQPQWQLLTRFLILSGLRYGEAAALEAKDIDLKEKKIRINKQYDSNHKIVTRPKTGNSYGDVDIQPDLERCVRDILRYDRTIMMGLGIRTNLLFFNDHGEHINYFSYDKYLKETTERMFGKRLTPHSLRHTHASLLFQQGYTVDEVSRRLRNTSKVAKEIYIHVTDDLKKKDRAKIMKTEILCCP